MIVLDTTVLVYAKGAEHPLRDPCRDLVAAIADERIAATTTAEVIQEFVHVRARRRDRSDAAALGRVTMPNCSRRYSPSIEATSKRGLTLFETTPGLEACDAVLAAVAASAGATALVSADPAFADLSDVVHVIPDAAGMVSLLGYR